MFSKIFYRKTHLYWLVIGVVIVKMLLLPFAQVTDADAVSRTFLADAWREHPVLIISHMWAPFYFYMYGFFLSIAHSLVYTIPVSNILFSAFMLIPFYFFVRREFNNIGAMYATIFLAISPVLFRTSFMALSEIPYLFFLILTLNFISKGTKENLKFCFVIAGLCITVASGFRFESWIISLLLFCMIILKGKWKEGFLFGFFAVIFPAIWLFLCWQSTGDMLISFKWTSEAVKNNIITDMGALLRRFWFFPFSWYIALGPVVAFLVLKQIFKRGRKGSDHILSLDWNIIFWVMMVVFEYNCFKGSLLQQHRFTGTLVLFSLPFIAEYFNENNFHKIRLVLISLVLVIGLSYVYNTDSITPLPRLKDKSVNCISNIVQNNLTRKSCLITDNFGWENTYFVALHSELNPANIIIRPGDDNNFDNLSKSIVSFAILNHNDGVIIWRNNSKLRHEAVFAKNKLFFSFCSDTLNADMIYSDDKVGILKWSKK